MKKIKLLSILFVLFISLSFGLIACNNPNDSDINKTEDKQTLILNKEEVTLEKLESFDLYLYNFDGDKSAIIWTSSHESVASVKDGVVRAESEGVTVITAELDGKVGKCTITVEDHELIPDIKTNVKNDVLYLTKGDDFDITTAFVYNNKEYNVDVNASIDTSDNAISFSNGKISALNNGAATIVFTSTWEGINVEKVISINVIDNMIASLNDSSEILIFNDRRAGDTEYKLSPTVYLDEKLLTEDEYILSSWSYDEDLLSFDADTLTIKALKKGNTDFVAVITTVNGGISIESKVSVFIELYNEDKSDRFILDTLYLDESNYYLSLKEIFKDKNTNELNNLNITSITDVTTGTTFDVPFNYDENYAVVDMIEIIKSGISGDRRWQIECGKYSYIVSVPVVDNNPAKPLVGTYDTETWDYKVVLKYEKNKQLIEFVSKKTGAVVDKGTYYLTPWNGNADNGFIRVLTDKGTIKGMRDAQGKNFTNSKDNLPYSTKGYYYDINGSEQISFALSGGDTYDKHVFKDLEDPTKYLTNEYSSILFAGTIKLNSDSTCTFSTKDKNVVGSYQLTPTAPFKGNITLNFDSDVFAGQKVLQGTYSYSKGGAKFTFNADGFGEITMQSKSYDNVYEQYAGYYRPSRTDWRIPMRFLPDGTCFFDHPNWSGYPSIGTYTLSNGALSITVEQPYAGLKNYSGTYEIRDGKRCFAFFISHAPGDDDTVFVQQNTAK